MNLKEIIEATLIELDRGTAADTIAQYAEKFTMYANEAVNEIARRFKACVVDVTQLTGNDYPGFDLTSSDFSHPCKRIMRVLPATYHDLGGGSFSFTMHLDRPPYEFSQFVHGAPYIHVWGNGVKAGDYVAVEYLYVPAPMSAASLSNTEPLSPDSPDIPEPLHSLIPLYIRAREQCGQDPSTQGTSSTFFALFNQAVRNIQRETMGTPDSFKLVGYHFD